jgi:hypothetical protein
VAISNHCGRLIANVVIAYDALLLSGPLGRYLAKGNEKVFDLFRRISPATWQHLHFLGHYARDKNLLFVVPSMPKTQLRVNQIGHTACCMSYLVGRSQHKDLYKCVGRF